MDGVSPPVGGSANIIRMFTMSIWVAQDMFLTGLSCWLIWPSSAFTDDKIFSIENILHPKDHIVLDPHQFNYQGQEGISLWDCLGEGFLKEACKLGISSFEKFLTHILEGKLLDEHDLSLICAYYLKVTHTCGG